MATLRQRKPSETEISKETERRDDEDEEKKKKMTKKKVVEEKKKWSCVDNCCWFIGCICSIWWFLLFLYHSMPASFPQYVTEAITGPLPDPPGVKLKKEGLTAKHPVVFVPGIVTAGLELWEGHQCADGLFRKRLWGGSFGEVYKRPLCWVEHMSLDNETGLDPSGIRVRPVPGLVAADYFAPGYFVWAVLIANLARIGYEEKTMYMASYDWRLSFQNTEVRDQTLSRIKSNIELMVNANGGKKVVVVPHSMGVLYFLHFMKWVESPAPMGGGGGSDWCSKHLKAVMNIGGPFLGVPKAVSGIFSAEAKDIAVARAIAPGFLDKDVFGQIGLHQTLQHVMRMTRTWDSTMSMIPKGGDTIWGDLDRSPEEGYDCSAKKQRNNDTQASAHNGTEDLVSQTKIVNYGRIISFGRDVAEASSSEIERMDFRDAVKGTNIANSSCRDIWAEYHDMGWGGIKAVADYKVYTAGSILDLLHYVAPKMMKRGDAHFSHGIAENLDDPAYRHYKYWSNPLETKLPNAPDMEIYSMYGVGIPTERAYVYKLSPNAECYIPFQIDTSADGENEGSCLKDGVYSVDGDETVPVLSAGFMCAKGWRGKTRFNPSGIRTYIREYDHAPPANLLEGRGTQSGAHVDIMGNFALIEDIIRVAGRMERIRLRLLFDDRHLLSKTQKSEGLKRSWLLLKPELETVDDFSSYLIHTFDLEDACPNGLLLSMDGFVLPLFESTRILKDKDIIRVKRKGGTLIDVIRVGDDANSIEDSEIIEKRPVLTGVKLLAIEEFEKETGGYQSDPEEDEHGGPESPLSFENTLSEKTISKKRKSSKKLHSSKRKKARVTSPEQHSLVPEGIENDGYPEQNESCYNSKVCSHKNHHKKVKSSKVNGKSSIAHTSEVDEKANNIADSTPTEERCGQAQENGTASVDLSHVAAGTRKFPSRSARRKKAKRQWLRELARSQKKEEQSATGQIIQSHTPEEDIHEKFLEHQQPDQNTDKEDEIVPIVVRPGHIRFEPLGEDLVIRQNPDQVETFWWNGTTSKKKGQKWGKEKTSLCGRNDNKDFNQDLIEKLIVEEREVVHDPIDFDNLIPLSSSPKEGDIVAYRLVELSSSWCPELSSFRVGKVSWCDCGSNRVRLVPLPEYPIVSDEKIDEDASAMQPETTLYNEDGSLEIDFASLVDVRIVYHGNSNRAAVVSGESVEVPVNNHDAVSGVDCNSNIEDIRAPITGKGEQVNLWEEISQTLSEKKTQLLQKDGWTKNESSGRNAWSYKALRSSALGPTMALLRAQSER